MAGPTKLTPERSERILRAMRAGNYLEAAARSAGVHPSTVYRWLERGERDADGPYRDFSEPYRSRRRANLMPVSALGRQDVAALCVRVLTASSRRSQARQAA